MTDATPVQIEEARAYAAGLRQLADMVELAPQIRRTATAAVTPWFPDTRDELIALTHAARAAGAVVERESDDLLFQLHFKFGPVIVKAISYRKDVCEHVVTGTREVTEMVPDPKAPAPPMVELKRVEEVVEWRCPDGRPSPTPAGGGA